jgi:tripartite-type tricarboxylate transporter receptor subunit TctC
MTFPTAGRVEFDDRENLMILRVAMLSCLIACGLAAHESSAQGWPEKAVRIVYATPPGGPLDLISRVIAAHLEQRYGNSAIVESRPGGGGVVATAFVAHSPPDGHTLLMGGAPAIALFVKDLPFDPFKDVAPVSIVGLQYYSLLASRATGVKTLQEFVAYAKNNPDKTNIGIVAAGRHEVETYAMLDALGITGKLIGYKGLAPIYVALLSGEMNATLGQTPPQLKTGDIVGLAIGGEKRNPDYPDIPTFREAGFPYDPQVQFTLFAAGATPHSLLARISSEMAIVAKSSEFYNKITRPLTIEGFGSSPEAAVRILREDYDKEKRIVDRVGIKPQ